MYQCNNCGYKATKYFGLCPKCRDGMGEEVQEVVEDKAGNGAALNKDILNKIEKFNPNIDKIKAIKSTKYPNFNAILSSGKGFVDSQIVLLAASPGVGKSTLCMEISDSDTLYISSEENSNQINSRAQRVNKDCKADLLCSTSIEDILSAIELTDKKFIIIDSLNSIEFGIGYTRIAKNAYDISEACKRLHKMCVIISQVTKTGEISGMNSIVHLVDTVIYLERSQVNSNIIATTSKNRFGEVGSITIFEHENDGLVELPDMIDEGDPEIGITYTEVRFGRKVMTIGIEALVVDSQGQYGMCRCNGYSFNRVQQILGILTYYSDSRLNHKDIYVSLSNGLNSQDTKLDASIANSILSSYFNKVALNNVYGEISLNGRIRNGQMNNKPLAHIKDLINYYRK